MASDRRFGLPPYRRIKKRSEFLTIQSSGRKVHTTHFVVIAKRREQSEITRLGVTITTKVDKRAVYRNRLRRRIKEYFRLNQDNIRLGADLVVIAKTGAVELGYADICGELRWGFKKAGLLTTVQDGDRAKQE